MCLCHAFSIHPLALSFYITIATSPSHAHFTCLFPVHFVFILVSLSAPSLPHPSCTGAFNRASNQLRRPQRRYTDPQTQTVLPQAPLFVPRPSRVPALQVTCASDRDVHRIDSALHSVHFLFPFRFTLLLTRSFSPEYFYLHLDITTTTMHLISLLFLALFAILHPVRSLLHIPFE